MCHDLWHSSCCKIQNNHTYLKRACIYACIKILHTYINTFMASQSHVIWDWTIPQKYCIPCSDMYITVYYIIYYYVWWGLVIHRKICHCFPDLVSYRQRPGFTLCSHVSMGCRGSKKQSGKIEEEKTEKIVAWLKRVGPCSVGALGSQMQEEEGSSM